MKIRTLLTKRVYGKIPVWTLMFLLIASIVGARAVVLFSHNFNVPSTSPALTSSCPGSTLAATPSTVIAGTGPGTILFTCPGGQAALQASSPGTVTPVFALPTAMSLFLLPPPAPSQPCDIANVEAELTSGTSIGFGTGLENLGPYDYCVSYTSFPSGGVGFSVTWSQ